MSRFSVCRMRTLLGTLWVLVAGVILPAAPRSLAQSAASKSEAGNGTAKSLFCGYGSVGFMPDPLPPGFETQFAVAVVEIDSPSETRDAAVSGFVLFDEAGKTTESKRVVSVEVFKRPGSRPRASTLTISIEGTSRGTLHRGTGRCPPGKSASAYALNS